MSRPTLAGTLWPESPGARAAANLRAAISRLPRPQGRHLVRSAGARMELAGDLHVDLHHAEHLIEKSSGTTTSTPESWRSDLLPFWDEDWVLLERERYRQARLHALERLGEQLRSQRRFGEAMQAALAALSGEPLRESAHRLAIEVHLTEGNAAEALRQYDLYRRLLRSELGIAPSTALRQLVRPLLERPED
ncbi:bacterial transcriptional activator domain-containing protein [Kineosporia sp. J2-2]|uniref:Bacterial transcriptional activator domain-containing protein n=1 Tax=Kineosporia corallincola TaxID=2835133 RepID=A0ABS5TIL6_9ACTN|nr:bacterial transcriptional activator domain-containing protein [Kineosporia corallincola]MBT0770916.1 bacterial transcriptional activator domain-containing protein [Kineosporia corallincola]